MAGFSIETVSLSARSSSNSLALGSPLGMPSHLTWTVVAPRIRAMVCCPPIPPSALPTLYLDVCFTECRSNLAPVYKPRGADVWSLGIVLINMYVPYITLILRHIFPSFSRSSRSLLIRSLLGFIIVTPGWTRSRMDAPLLTSIFLTRSTSSCGDSPV
jgi:hypothetical protein